MARMNIILLESNTLKIADAVGVVGLRRGDKTTELIDFKFSHGWWCRMPKSGLELRSRIRSESLINQSLCMSTFGTIRKLGTYKIVPNVGNFAKAGFQSEKFDPTPFKTSGCLAAVSGIIGLPCRYI